MILTSTSRSFVAVAWLLLGAHVVDAALNLDGTQAVDPLEEGDPSPIGDLTTYYPDQHDCPLPCVDYANMHSWTPFLSVKRLERCKEPMLLQLSITLPLDDPLSNVLIRSCTFGQPRLKTVAGPGDGTLNLEPVENPKKSADLFQASLNTTPACVSIGKAASREMQVMASSDGGKVDSGEVRNVLKGLQDFFETPDNCDETFAFAYHGQTVASVYIGPGLGKPTVSSALEKLVGSSPASNRTIAQLCNGEDPTQMVGIAIDTTGDLAAVQKIAVDWSKGSCVEQGEQQIPGIDLAIEVFEIAGSTAASGNNVTSINSNRTVTTRAYADRKRSYVWEKSDDLNKRATCSYIQVVVGDGCASLVSRCGISAADFTKYNPKTDLCSALQAGDYVCCSAGDPYSEPKPDPPKQGEDGVCATHLIQNGDSCSSLAKQYGVTVDDLEKWNKGKTWAWTECKNMLLGYNMCLSDGKAGLPPPQAGAECGPLVPGTILSDSTVSIADLNPCPLKACCSNWGFCGVFPAHCDIHAPEGGGPGSKLDGFENTCVSNCGNDIKQNSGAPATFSRIGYYSAFNLQRECLWLSAKDANTDGSYTHIHWAFGEIDATTWKPVIKEYKTGQWAEFKALKNVKKIVSFGGWAASTEPATYNIIRSAIITNRNIFAANLAAFAKAESIDGIDIDWEYPGAPDILVDGIPIGKTTDGADYLKFLTVLKQQLGTDRSVSIAAPASYWYLKAFPIDRISTVIDYIVYMTYDLHGQWDAGNPNAYDQCDSGRCIRSHVNLTETHNSLSIITKAGVANNKVFVGESSYGRSFHMATDGCWGPMCDFTGSRTESEANPGRCTKTGGYLGNAEINELISRGGAEQTFHDTASNTDILLYKGDYVSYMTPTTKNTRRSDWKSLNFAGSIDWALDLQGFTTDDMSKPPDRPNKGEEGCVWGEDRSVNSGDLCEFSCSLGFCPESLCVCTDTDIINELPTEKSNADIVAWDGDDVDLNRLCLFACKYGYCPEEICTTIPKDDVVITNDDNPNGFDYEAARQENAKRCFIYQDSSLRDYSVQQCYNTCKPQLDAAKEAGRTSNYGCMGFWPLEESIPWQKPPGTFDYIAPGQCLCDNWLLNEIADTIIEALPIIAQIGCYILMSSLKLVLDIGLQAIPGVGKALDAGLDMATTAAQMASYLYPEEEDPEGAFSWWLSPCGGTSLVPDEIKQIFGILSTVADGVSSFKTPKNLKKGSGKKGDDANPTDQGTPRAPGNGNGKNRPKCNVPPRSSTIRLQHTIREQSCLNDKTEVTEWIVTSLAYASNAQATGVSKPCDFNKWPQACGHYSSALRNNPGWATLTCPPEAAATEKPEMTRKVPTIWKNQHNGLGWWDVASGNRPQLTGRQVCQADEYPPLYLLNAQSPSYINAGSPGGQLSRMLPSKQNSNAANGMWTGMCFLSQLTDTEISNQDFKARVDAAGVNLKVTDKNDVARNKHTEQRFAMITVNKRPEFSISNFVGAALPNDGLNQNPCWPQNIAPRDPGFTLFSNDPYYTNSNPPNFQYNYKQPYSVPGNGG